MALSALVKTLRARFAVLLALVLGAALLAGAAARADAPTERLPDLVQLMPDQLQVEASDQPDGRHWMLGFWSAVANEGEGPLQFQGRDPYQKTLPDGSKDYFMHADQLVTISDGSLERNRDVGTLHYYTGFGHVHWHLEPFDRYELRRVQDYKQVATDRKQGFCLGSRRRISDFSYVPYDGPFGNQDWNGSCMANQPDADTVTEGIQVGWADDYPPLVEGQQIDITHVPAGRYYLVHRANADGVIRESDLSNNASSVQISIYWPPQSGAAPQVTVRRSCFGQEKCPVGDESTLPPPPEDSPPPPPGSPPSPPASPVPPAPPAPIVEQSVTPRDTRSPRVTAGGRRRQRLADGDTVFISARCDELCSVLEKGLLRARRSSVRIGAAGGATLAANERGRVPFKLSPRAVRIARSAFAHRRSVWLEVEVLAVDKTGNETRRSGRTIRIVPGASKAGRTAPRLSTAAARALGLYCHLGGRLGR